MKLRTEIQRAATAQGITNAYIAKKSGVAASIVSRYFRGKNDVTTATADRMMRVLGLKVERSER